MAKIIQDSTDIIRELQSNNVDLQLKLSNNVKNKFEYLEKALPHEDATGTDITMDNTAEYYIRTHEIEGDTDQFTTTGKNKLDLSQCTFTNCTYNNGVITSNINNSYYCKISSTQFNDLSNVGKTFTLSFKDAIVGRFCSAVIFGTRTGGQTYQEENSYSNQNNLTFTIANDFTSITQVEFRLNRQSSTFDDTTTIFTDVQLEEGSSVTSYEPYTGGTASPNPDYPQDVEVVKGYNLLPNNVETYTASGVTRTKNADGSITLNGTASANGSFDIGKVKVKKNVYYTLSGVEGYAQNQLRIFINSSVAFPAGHRIECYNFPQTEYALGDEEVTFYVQFYNGVTFNNTKIYPMLNKGPKKPYLPYNNVGIMVENKNLFNDENYLITSGASTSRDGHKLTITSTSTGGNRYVAYTLGYGELLGKTLTISSTMTGTTGGIRLFYLNKSRSAFASVTGAYYPSDNKWTVTLPDKFPNGGIAVGILFYANFTSADSGTTMIFENTQVEMGEDKTAYQPYQKPQIYPLTMGDTELCKIDGYQDCFKKSTGKNLFSSKIELGSISGTGQKTDSTTQCRTKDHISIKPSTQYSLWNDKSQTYNLYFYDENKTYLSYSYVSGNTFTSPANAKYVMFLFGIVDLDISVMLNEGSTALPYEPYGKGTWYLHEEIGKVVFDGTESWTRVNYEPDNNWVQFRLDLSNSVATQSPLSNYFKGGDYTVIYAQKSTGITIDNNSRIRISFDNLDIITADSFKTWLGTHNTKAYYILSTPTNTIITDTTLLQQLNDLDNATSYEDVTYLTTLGDLPPIVDVTYFQDIKKLISSQN